MPNDVTLTGRGAESAVGGGTYAGGSAALGAAASASLVPQLSQKREVSTFELWQVGQMIIGFAERYSTRLSRSGKS